MFATTDKKRRWAVVLAGGDGTRLQRLTRTISGDPRPKQFCKLFGEKSLLTHTRERIAPLFNKERILFALARAHKDYYRRDLGDVEDHRKIVQPLNRGTAIAMALCLHSIAKQSDEAIVAFFPSDHHYRNPPAFQQAVECGLQAIERHPEFVLMLGAQPTYPEVEYGWIQAGRALEGSLNHPLQRVTRFWEKPDSPRARVLQRRGCLWNTFVTIGLASAFLELLEATAPRLTQPLKISFSDGRLEDFYRSVPALDFSRDVLSRVPRRLLVLRDAESGWTDLGSPARVMEVLGRDGIQPAWLGRDEAFQAPSL
jgi:mannose-1-phosphate guanylyltransferase